MVESPRNFNLLVWCERLTRFHYVLFWSGILFILLIVFPAALLAGSYRDKTFFIEGSGIGILEHFGMWGFVLTNPIILFLSFFVWRKSMASFKQRKKYTENMDSPTRAIVLRLYIILRGKTSFSRSYIIMVLIGVFSAFVNIWQTVSPNEIYGHDVFDSISHINGYIAAKIFLSFTFIIVYPISIYISAKSSIIIFLFLFIIKKSNHAVVNFFDNDKCGGYSDFGQINLIVMLVQIGIFSTILLLMTTHSTRYLSVNVPLIAMSTWIFIQSVIGVYPIHGIIKSRKDSAISYIDSILNAAIRSREEISIFPHNVLVLKKHIESTHTFPYSDKIFVFMNIVRFAPAIFSVYKTIPITH